MAETEYMRLSCRGCGVPVLPTLNKDGTLRKNQAQACSHRCVQRKLAGVEAIDRVCKQCATSIEHLSLYFKHCSARCRDAWRENRKAEKKRLAKAPPPLVACSQCDRPFQPRWARHNKFCSSGCKKAWHNGRLLGPAREEAERKRQVKALLKLRERQERDERRARRKAAEAIAQAMLANRTCEDCGQLTGNARAKLCPQCSEVRARNQKRVARIRRKALQRAATAESVDPIKVFQRAGWRCYLCGCATPEELRGTYEPNAPELEHVVPLSKGGAHSYANTGCACRACNLEKSDRTLEELLA